MLAVVRGTWRRIAAIIAECNYAQRRLTQLKASPDRHLARPGLAPDTYEEFLFRTSGPLAHEPSAAKRASGRAIL
jgi:hypothetical protein